MGANDRFPVVAQPTMAPGQCLICKSVSRGPFVDTRVDDKWNGWVTYICMGCISDMAVCAGYKLVSLEEESQDDKNEENFVRGWRAALTAVSEDFNAITNLYLARAGDSPVLPDSPSDSGDAGNLPGDEVVQTSPERQEGSGTSADGTPKQNGRLAKRKGPASVSDDSGSEPALTLPDL